MSSLSFVMMLFIWLVRFDTLLSCLFISREFFFFQLSTTTSPTEYFRFIIFSCLFSSSSSSISLVSILAAFNQVGGRSPGTLLISDSHVRGGTRA